MPVDPNLLSLHLSVDMWTVRHNHVWRTPCEGEGRNVQAKESEIAGRSPEAAKKVEGRFSFSFQKE